MPVTTSPVVEADAGLHAKLGQRVPHLDRGAAGTQRVVLVRLRDAEDGHHRIADELLHRAAVRLDDRLHPLEVAGEQRSQRLRVGRLSELRRTGDVAEQHRDHLALLAHIRSRRGRSTLGAEPESRLGPIPTRGARSHQPRLDPHANHHKRPAPKQKAVGWASVRRRRLSDRRAQPAGGDQTYGVVVVTATKPSRSRIGRLSGEAST